MKNPKMTDNKLFYFFTLGIISKSRKSTTLRNEKDMGCESDRSKIPGNRSDLLFCKNLWFDISPNLTPQTNGIQEVR